MKTVANILALAIVTAVLGGVGYAAFLAAGEVGTHLGELDPLARTILFTVGVVGLLGAVIVAGGLRAAARIVAASRLHREREELYRLLVTHYRAVVAGAPSVLDAEVLDGLESELLLLGAAAVVRAYRRIKEADGGDEPLVNDLVQAMRADLGHARAFDGGAVGEFLASRERGARTLTLQEQV